MSHPLDQLIEDGIIQEVVARLKSGKEADIYLVQHAGEIVAAKLYKERHARNFKNNAAYKEGRTVRNSRTQRAIDRGSRFGQEAAEEEWKAKESDVLHKLYAAQVRVPQPVLFYEGILLMEAVIDPEGHPAPRLIDAPIPPERAADLYADLRQQMIKMLLCDLIHGDLSPYNVLLAWNGPTIIDFPQVVDAAHNRQAAFFFDRDLQTIRRFFAGFDRSLDAREGDAHEIWRAWERRDLSPDFVPPIRPLAPGRGFGRGGPPAGRGDARGGTRGPPPPGPGRDQRRGPPGGGDARGPRRGPGGPTVEVRGAGRSVPLTAEAPGRGTPAGGEARGPGRGPRSSGDPRGHGRAPAGGADAGRPGRGSQNGTGPRAAGHTPSSGGEPRGGPGPGRGAPPGGEERGTPAPAEGRGAPPRVHDDRRSPGRSAGPQVSFRGPVEAGRSVPQPGPAGQPGAGAGAGAEPGRRKKRRGRRGRGRGGAGGPGGGGPSNAPSGT